MVSRRSFIGAGASLLLAPLLKIQPSIDRHALLMMFTGEGFRRYDFSRPYSFNNYAYASCGRSMARIASKESELLDDTIRVPPVEAVWSMYYSPATQWTRFELHDIADLKPSIRDYSFCPECDSDRWVKAPDDYILGAGDSYDPDSHEILDPNCPVCHGRVYTGPCYQRTAGVLINYHFAKRLGKIPGCEVAMGEPVLQPTYDGKSEWHRPLLFRSDLITGIVCAIKED